MIRLIVYVVGLLLAIGSSIACFNDNFQAAYGLAITCAWMYSFHLKEIEL